MTKVTTLTPEVFNGSYRYFLQSKRDDEPLWLNEYIYMVKTDLFKIYEIVLILPRFPVLGQVIKVYNNGITKKKLTIEKSDQNEYFIKPKKTSNFERSILVPILGMELVLMQDSGGINWHEI